MKNLKVQTVKLESKNINVTDSREVAKMLGKEHYDLIKEIDGRKDGKTVGLIPTLEKGNFPVSNYFIESSYKSGNRNYKNYLITKMGCELLGNKQQGEKGILFTATYVQAFNDMEQTLKGNMTLDSMLGTLQEFKAMQENIEIMKRNMKLVQNNMNAIYEEVEESKKIGLGAYLMAKDMSEDVNEKLKQLKNVYEVVNDSRWRESTDTLLKSTAYSLGNISCIANLRRKIYSLMEKRLCIDFDNTIKRRAKRMALEGVCKSKINKINPMTIISEDKKLIDSYVSTVREVCIAFTSGIYSLEE